MSAALVEQNPAEVQAIRVIGNARQQFAIQSVGLRQLPTLVMAERGLKSCQTGGAISRLRRAGGRVIFGHFSRPTSPGTSAGFPATQANRIGRHWCA